MLLISGLLNLYHAFEGENHTLVVFIKHQEMSLYAKMWPNHVLVGLPKDSDHEGIGSARYFIKVRLSHHRVTTGRLTS